MKRLRLLLWILALSSASLALYPLSQEEAQLLRQDGKVSLKDHPDPQALKKTIFTIDFDRSPRAAAVAALSPTPSPIEPNQKKTSNPSPERYLSAAQLLADKIKSGQTPSALEQSRQLAQEHPQVAVQLSSQLWDGWISPLLFEGDDQQAMDFLKVQIALDEKDAQAHEALGLLYWRTGQDGLARSHYKKALSISPGKTYLEKRLLRLGM